MRSSRYASLTRLVIGASIIAGLFGTTASVALAASPVTFGILREEDPHNGVQTIDQVYRDTDTITGTGDLATGFTVNLSSSSPGPDRVARDHRADRRRRSTTGTTHNVDRHADRDHARRRPHRRRERLRLQPGRAHDQRARLRRHGRRRPEPHVRGDLPRRFGEVHAQVAIAATGTSTPSRPSPTNTLAIGDVNVGGTSPPHTITFTNIGNAAVDMSTLAKGGRYPELYTFTKIVRRDPRRRRLVHRDDGLQADHVRPQGRRGHAGMTGDDISADGLHKEVLVTATGILPDATNIDPGHRHGDRRPRRPPCRSSTASSSQNVVATDSGHCGNPANAAIWYHFKSTTDQDARPDHDRQRRRDGHRAVHRRRPARPSSSAASTSTSTCATS